MVLTAKRKKYIKKTQNNAKLYLLYSCNHCVLPNPTLPDLQPLSYLVFDTTLLMATNLRFIGHMHGKYITEYFVTNLNLLVFFSSFQIGVSALNSGTLQDFDSKEFLQVFQGFSNCTQLCPLSSFLLLMASTFHDESGSTSGTWTLPNFSLLTPYPQ